MKNKTNRTLIIAKAAIALGLKDPIGRVLAEIVADEVEESEESNEPLEQTPPEERAEGDSPQEIVVESVDGRMRGIIDDMVKVQERLHDMLEEGDSDGFIKEISSMKVLASGMVSIVEDVEILAASDEEEQQGWF